MQVFKRLIIVFVILSLATTLWAKPKVVATIYPLYLLLKDIGKDKVESFYLIGPYVSPHGYELTPQAFLKLKKSDGIVAVGCGLEDWLKKAISSKKVFYLCNGVKLIDKNPHIWLSPRIVANKLLDLAHFLSELDPQNKSFFEKRAIQVKKELEQLVQEENSNCAVIGHHNAWVYFAMDLGYNYIGSIEEVPHQEPSFGRIREIIKLASGRSCILVIAETGHNLKVAKLIAGKLGAKLVVLNPLGDYEDKGFVEFMKRLVFAVKNRR